MRKRRKYVVLGIILVLGFLIFNKTLSELKPIPKVTFKSQNLDYDKKEPGSFKVDKSAKWIGEGKAKVTIEVDSVIKEKSKAKDIIFVLDVSGSMSGDKLNQVKKDTTDLATAVLSNPRNRVALITFDTGAELVSGFTSNKDEFLQKVNNLYVRGATNYKAGLEEVRKLLEGYKNEDRKDLVLLFLTDGFPCVDTPNEVAVYNQLRQMYPNMKINAVQYEMGDNIQDSIKAISERQFSADMKGLNNVLFEAGANPVIYDNFVITDYISKHFKGNATKIKASQGEVKLEGDQVTWNLETYRSGTKATLEIELENVGSREEFYKTNKGIDIKTSLEKQKDHQISSKTPILKGLYNVIYEANTPQGCTVKGLEKITSHRPFEKVELVKGKATCDGYLFSGYKLTSAVKYINEDYIEMPEKDVVLRAIWTKINVKKVMNGSVGYRTLYEEIESSSLGNDRERGIIREHEEDIDYEGPVSLHKEGVYLFDETKNDINPVYFYTGTQKLKNNLIFGNFCWKIVRTTETRGVRIIYNGAPVNGKCTNTTGDSTQIGTSKFNTDYRKKKYVGYMFGDDSNPYENKYDSDIKKYIDNWYKINIKDKGYESSLDKASIYCGDRTEGSPAMEPMSIDKNDRASMIKNLYTYKNHEGLLLETTPLNNLKTTSFYYKSIDRKHMGKPTMGCPIDDSYGVEAGNKKLSYPIALLSLDEISLTSYPSMNNYLLTDYKIWLLSPRLWYRYGEADVTFVSNEHSIGNNIDMPYSYGVRPALTIKGESSILNGDGSQNNPYVI